MFSQSQQPSLGEQIGGEIGKEVGKAVGKEIENNLTGKGSGRKKKGKSPAARRVGYAFGIVCALLFLWVINNFDNWGWKFITDEWNQVDRIVRISIIIDLIAYGVFMVYDGRLVYSLGKLVSNVFSIYVSIRMFQVFPFDFNFLFGGWGWLNSVFPILIILGIVGLGIAPIVRAAKLAAGKDIYD